MITKNHTIELKDTSVSEMARFRQIMLGIWSQQKEDDKNGDEMLKYIQSYREIEFKKIPSHNIAAPKKISGPIKGYAVNVIEVKSFIPGTTTPDTYQFTKSAVHLLSLVSGVDKKSIQSTTLEFKKYGGGAMTTGDNSKSGTITYYNQRANSLDFIELSSHEVGHLPQLDDYGGAKHIARSIGAYLVEAIINLDAINEVYDPKTNNLDYETIVHNSSPLEQQAEVGSGIFRDFSKFVDNHYGKGKDSMIQKLFNNKNNSDTTIIRKLDKWWNAYKNEKYEKIDYSDVSDD
ncbi:hypothetical protein [Flavobacterium sp.]|uniref:hypothetical protein n=1 Tax=Flavobacterium sp. TaxID=239 RepID=UPI0025BC0CC0|nr:hypothetical protein [Flavobacterium sp.]